MKQNYNVQNRSATEYMYDAYKRFNNNAHFTTGSFETLMNFKDVVLRMLWKVCIGTRPSSPIFLVGWIL